MKRVANIFMFFGFLLGGITIVCVAAYGVLEYFGFLFVDKINIVESMSSILKVSYFCFAGTIVAFFVYYRLVNRINN